MNPMVESLRAVPLFSELSSRDLKGMADSMKVQSFADGDEVVAQDKSGVGFFVILDGTARVSQDGEDRGRLTAGEYFGELALIDGDVRLASVHAEGDLRCAYMTTWKFRPFVRAHPDVAWALLSALVKRLRDAHAQQAAAVR